METLILIAHVVLAIALVALVLLQQGKGAEAGAAFGSGASQTMFGSQGNGSFLGRATGVIALGIFITSFTLAVYAKQKAESVSDQGIPSSMVSEESGQQVPDFKEIVQPSTEVPKAD
ncbi:MAG: preprotein translocase subunit SecG [Motiliproteus sp.]|jgi:preprotein translocase subunit SecG